MNNIGINNDINISLLTEIKAIKINENPIFVVQTKNLYAKELFISNISFVKRMFKNEKYIIIANKTILCLLKSNFFINLFLILFFSMIIS